VNDLLDELSRRKKQVIAVATDVVMLPIALWCAFSLRLGELTPDIARFWPVFLVCVCVAVPAFGRLGLYRQVIRYMGRHALVTVAIVVSAGHYRCRVSTETACRRVPSLGAYHFLDVGVPLR